MRVVIAGGGTAGHAYPGIALGEVLRDRGVQVLFIGTPQGPEARLAHDRSFPFEAVEVAGRSRGINLHNLRALVVLARATWRSIALLAKVDPHYVVTTGGYVSLPVALAAAVHRIPIVVHEQNTVPGLANRIASRFARAIAVSFKGSEERFGQRAHLVGNPVRPEIAGLDRETARERAIGEFGLAPARRTVLIAGGSQGARSINEAAFGLYTRWRGREEIQVLHLAGPRNIQEAEQRMETLRGAGDRILWRLLGYTERMDLAYSIADLAVCRAGATTVAELAAARIPAVLVPFPYAVDNDQLGNAEAAIAAGGAELILDADLDAGTLQSRVESLLGDERRLEAMRTGIASLFIPNSAERLADLVLKLESESEREPAAGLRNQLRPTWTRVHMVGIGGAGMSAIARVLAHAGVEVTGSDLIDSTTVESLMSLGMKLWVGHEPEHVEGADVVIVSSAVPDDNVEVAAARLRGISIVSRGEALALILEGKRTVAVSGTHGKTTTSGMIATVLERAGLDPTYLLGADISDRGPGGKLGSGEIAVVEADEAYGSFLALEPAIAMILNVDRDHLDYYGTMEALEEAFARFAAGAEQLIVCLDDPGAAKLDHLYRMTYGLDEGAQVTAANLIKGADGSRFDLVVHGAAFGKVALEIPGRRNVQNALGAAAACVALGLEPAAVTDGLSFFRGVSRRFEYRGSLYGADLVDDYAHHPTEIEATLADARWGPWQRIVAVFQPHLYSRTQSLWREFGIALTQADLVVVTDVYGAREDPVPGVTGKMVAEAVCEAAPGKRVAYLPRLREAAGFVRNEIRPGDLVLSLGAGDITTFPERLMEGER